MERIKLSDHFTYTKLLKFVLPAIIMMVFTSIYSVADGLFVVNLASTSSYKGVNLGWPIIGLISAIGFMIGSGGSALVGKKLGEGDKESANKYFSLFIYSSIIIATLLAIPTFIFMPDLIGLFQATEEETISEAITYGRILVCFIPAFVLQMEFQSFYIVAEKSKLNTYTTIIAGLTNIILDVLFIGVFKLHAAGAAIGTGIAQLVGATIPLIYFGRKNNSLLKLGKTNFEYKPLLKCFSNGSSEFLSNIALNLMSILYNKQLINIIGENGVAAYGTFMYVCLFFLAVFFGFNLGVSPLISYNLGAKNTTELQNLTRKSVVIVSIFSVLMCGLSFSLSYPISLLFSGGNSELVDLTFSAFLFLSGTFLFCGITVFASALFTALNNGFVSAFISFFRTFTFPITLIFVLPLMFHGDAIWITMLVSEFLAMIVAISAILINNKRYHYFR